MWRDLIILFFFILIFLLSLIICTIILRARKFNDTPASKRTKCHCPTRNTCSLNVDRNVQNYKMKDICGIGGDKSEKIRCQCESLSRFLY